MTLPHLVSIGKTFVDEHDDENRATCANERNRAVLNTCQDSQISRGTLKLEMHKARQIISSIGLRVIIVKHKK